MDIDQEELSILNKVFQDMGIEPTKEQIVTLHQWGIGLLEGGYHQGLQRAADVASFQMDQEELDEFVDSLNNAVFFKGGMVR